MTSASRIGHHLWRVPGHGRRSPGKFAQMRVSPCWMHGSSVAASSAANDPNPKSFNTCQARLPRFPVLRGLCDRMTIKSRSQLVLTLCSRATPSHRSSKTCNKCSRHSRPSTRDRRHSLSPNLRHQQDPRRRADHRQINYRCTNLGQYRSHGRP